MIGKLTIDKSSMNISYFLYTIKIIASNEGKISRKNFVKEMADFVGVPAVQNNKENRTAYNKSKLPRYFGFVDIVADEQELNYLVLTNRGEILVEYIQDNGEDKDAVERYSIPFDEKRFVMALKEKLRSENNDKNKALFSSMIDMIQYVGKKGKNARFFFGTNDFEYVWERLIDFNFGEDNKNFYFPRTSWYLGTEGKHAKSALEPDTIMREDDKVFILDAKYYRYGDSKDPTELPRSTSINKQITYGEYVATDPKFKDKNGQAPPVYNVFLMPFNKNGQVFPSKENMLHIGEARGDWKDSGVSYERVQGVLLDIKWMMARTVKHNKKDISQLARLVESIIQKTDPLAKKKDDNVERAMTM